jgi:hypothetical protein
MLGLNLGRYVIIRLNIVCGTLLFLIVEPILIKKEIKLRSVRNNLIKYRLRNVIIFNRGTYINKKKEIVLRDYTTYKLWVY